jgi:hypothetical protein
MSVITPRQVVSTTLSTVRQTSCSQCRHYCKIYSAALYRSDAVDRIRLQSIAASATASAAACCVLLLLFLTPCFGADVSAYVTRGDNVTKWTA